MKKISTFLFASLFAVVSYAQTNIPQLVSFSAVVRDANNQPLVNTPVSIRLTFKQGGQTGPLVYCALHQNTTNQNGFISLQLNRNVLGTGCNGAPSTAFQNIPWENGGFWMEVEYQTVPGSPFVNLGQLELASSFYAFAAGTAERIAGFNLNGANDGDVLTYNITTQQWEAMPPSGGGTGFSGNYNDLTNKPMTIIPRIGERNNRLSVSFSGGDNVSFSQASNSCPTIWASASLKLSQGTSTINVDAIDAYFIDSKRFDVIFDIPWFIPSGLYDIILGPGTGCQQVIPASFKVH